MLKPRAQAFIDELLEDREVGIGEGFGGEETDELLGAIHIAGEVAEGHFRLDHPELGGVAGGVGIFRAEGGAEGVDVREGAGEGFPLKLAGDGEVGALAEKVLGVLRDPVIRQGGHAEHLPRPLAIAGGDDGRVHMDEIALLEKAVDRVGHAGAEPEGCAEEVRARAQVGDGAQELRRVAFLLQRIILRSRAEELDRRGLHFPILPLRRGRNQFPRHGNGGAGGHAVDLLVSGYPRIRHDLEIPQARAVVQLDERESLRVPPRPHPAGHLQRIGSLFPGQDVLDERAHGGMLNSAPQKLKKDAQELQAFASSYLATCNFPRGSRT